ncbi:MAG: IS1595 family transposase [Chitinispirillales bacterium]|jgi:transposase-like protein|nr:IS1595 family transposase [Chitinispirillales bacterium]
MLSLRSFNSILELLKEFSTEQVCIEHLESMRWNGSIVSPFDPDSKVYKCKGGKYRCRNTGKYFNVKTGTLFDNTKIKLKKWFLAIWLITSHKKGISSLQLSRDINVTQKTAWFMLQRIRKCFGAENNNVLDNLVECDETYIGGKSKHQGRSTKHKTPVVGMVQRGGKVNAKVVEDASKQTLSNLITKSVKKTATLFTDSWGGYNDMSKFYDHRVIKHKEHQYVNGIVHTNTIEGFWSLLKRGLLGIYHSTSRKHLQKYVDEFVFRYNTKGIGESERFNWLIENMGIKTTYKGLIAA